MVMGGVTDHGVDTTSRRNGTGSSGITRGLGCVVTSTSFLSLHR